MRRALSAVRVEHGVVLQVERLGDLIELTARLPHLAAHAQPGQFAQIRCSGAESPLLRRPFSVAWTEADVCGFVFEEVGAGTRALGGLHEGDELDILGPLGNGFSLQPAGAVVCVSGGVGCAPFPLLIAALRDRGVVDITVLNGATTASRLYPAERFGRGHDVRVLESTDDGSRGARGRVTALLPDALAGGPAMVYACGPNAMLAAVAAVTRERAQRCEASLEAPMGCGFGTCLGCALPVAGDAPPRWALCCTDGPVFDVDHIDWGTLLTMTVAA